jgi:hypothetical protein
LNPLLLKTKSFAPVAPLHVLQQLGDDAGNYHLLLAHEVLADIGSWNRLFNLRPGRDFIIMDNSLIETGQPLDADKLLEAFDAVSANVLVLPDKLGDTEETIRLSIQAFEQLTKLKIRPEDTLIVAQGQSTADLVSCVGTIANHIGDLPGMISVPRVVCQQLGTRVDSLVKN